MQCERCQQSNADVSWKRLPIQGGEEVSMCFACAHGESATLTWLLRQLNGFGVTRIEGVFGEIIFLTE